MLASHAGQKAAAVGHAPLYQHVADVNPAELSQELTSSKAYPESHVGLHVSPNWSVALQSPSPPLTGAVTLHPSG
jgi:hypothetical protein